MVLVKLISVMQNSHFTPDRRSVKLLSERKSVKISEQGSQIFTPHDIKLTITPITINTGGNIMLYGVGVFAVSAVITHYMEKHTPSVLKED